MRAELDVTLRDASRTPAERAALESVREDVDRMSRTVGNLLTLALADEDGLELLRTPIDLAQLAEGAVDPLRALAALGHVTLEYAGEPCWTTGNPQRLTQALTNLIENAIKFTPAGGQVTISTWRRGHEVGVAVADTGVGIDPDVQAQIFDRFFRADGSRSRASGGSGLGLAICKEIAVAHGGRIWVESRPGHGSRFSIGLSAGRPAPDSTLRHQILSAAPAARSESTGPPEPAVRPGSAARQVIDVERAARAVAVRVALGDDDAPADGDRAVPVAARRRQSASTFSPGGR